MKKKNKNKIKFTKEDIEYILARKLLDYEYEFISKAIPAMRDDSKILVAWGRRGMSRTKLMNESFILNGLIADDVIFEEASHD